MLRKVVFAALLCGVLSVASLARAVEWDTVRWAASMGQKAEVAAALDGGFDINYQNTEGWTLLMVAAEQGKTEMIGYLLGRGADATLKSGTGKTAFDYAYKAEDKRLLSGAQAGQGAPAPKKPQAETWKEARWAIEYNRLDEVERLLDGGLSIDARDANGWTLLMVAAWKDKPAAVKMLLRRGASKTLANNKGERAAALTTSAEVRGLLGAPSPASQAQVPTGRAAYCKRLGGQAYNLCGSNDRTCRYTALNKQQQCEKTGRWP